MFGLSVFRASSYPHFVTTNITHIQYLASVCLTVNTYVSTKEKNQIPEHPFLYLCPILEQI